MRWTDALKIWNAEHNTGKWCVPRKGTPGHAQVMAIIGKAKSEAAPKAGGKAPTRGLEQPKPKMGASEGTLAAQAKARAARERMVKAREAGGRLATATAKKRIGKALLARALSKREAKKTNAAKVEAQIKRLQEKAAAAAAGGGGAAAGGGGGETEKVTKAILKQKLEQKAMALAEKTSGVGASREALKKLQDSFEEYIRQYKKLLSQENAIRNYEIGERFYSKTNDELTPAELVTVKKISAEQKQLDKKASDIMAKIKIMTRLVAAQERAFPLEKRNKVTVDEDGLENAVKRIPAEGGAFMFHMGEKAGKAIRKSGAFMRTAAETKKISIPSTEEERLALVREYMETMGRQTASIWNIGGKIPLYHIDAAF